MKFSIGDVELIAYFTFTVVLENLGCYMTKC